MASNGLIALWCKITRSGFNSKRVFRLRLAGGAEHIGAAPARYFFTEKGAPLGGDQPPRKELPLPGLIAAREVLRDPDGTIWVSVPSGEVLPVTDEEVTEYPEKAGTDVPVGP